MTHLQQPHTFQASFRYSVWQYCYSEVEFHTVKNYFGVRPEDMENKSRRPFFLDPICETHRMNYIKHINIFSDSSPAEYNRLGFSQYHEYFLWTSGYTNPTILFVHTAWPWRNPLPVENNFGWPALHAQELKGSIEENESMASFLDFRLIAYLRMTVKNAQILSITALNGWLRDPNLS